MTSHSNRVDRHLGSPRCRFEHLVSLRRLIDLGLFLTDRVEFEITKRTFHYQLLEFV